MLKMFLFGPPRIEAGDQPVDLQRRKALALLIYLAMNNKPASRDTLATLFYPDNSQQRARAYLRRDLAVLNGSMDSDRLLVDRETIQLKQDDDFWLDIDAFRRLLNIVQAHQHSPAELCDNCLDVLTEASSLYSDDFLHGFTLRDAPEFDDWQFFQAEDLRQEFSRMLGKMVQALFAKGAYDTAIPFARRQLGMDPLHEPSHRMLMQLYAAAGQQAAALRQYEECVRILEDEFGILPDEVTSTLYEDIKARRFDAPSPKTVEPQPLTAAGPAVAAIARPDVAPPPEDSLLSLAGDSLTPDVTRQPPFIGRQHELNQMVTLIDRATGRQSQVMLIEGESGIGKSRLVEEAVSYAQTQGHRFLAGKCYEAEQSLPYQVVIHLVDQTMKHWPPEILQQVPPAALAEIARLVPEISQLFPDLPHPSDFQEARQGQLFRALFQLVSVLAGQSGLLLVVDDLQWADLMTLQWFNYLVHHVAAEPVVLVGAYRSEEAATDKNLTVLLESWQHQPCVSHLRLERLSPQEATALVEQVLPESPQTAALAQRLYQETAGHPFFLISILQSLVEQGVSSQNQWSADASPLKSAGAGPLLPEAVRQSVHNRLRHLSQTTRSVINLAAVYGRDFDFQLLRALTQRDQDELLDILENLLTRRLWREIDAGHVYDFCHDKIREVVYDELSGIRRVMLHRQVAEAIAGLTNWKRVGLLAEHFEKGEVWDKAVTCLEQAAERATRLFAMGDAAGFYNRAIKIIEANPDIVDDATRYRLYEQRGKARTHAGKLAGGIADLRLVLQYAQQIDDINWQRALLIELGQACRKADRLDHAIDWLTRALGLARQTGDEVAEASILYHLGTISFSAGDYYQATKHHQAAVDICDRLGNIDLVAVQAYHGRGEAYFGTGNPATAIEYYNKSLKMARQIGDKSFEAENLQMIGFAHSGLVGTANYKASLQSYAESITISQKLGLDWLNWATVTGWASAMGSSGDYGQALEQLEQHIDRLKQVQAPRYLSFAYDAYGDLLRDLNLPEQAEAAHQVGLEIAVTAKIHFWYPRLLANCAIDRIRRGNLAVEDDLLAALTETAKSGAVFHEVRCLEGLTELYLAMGSKKAALEYANYLLAAANLGGARELTAHAHRWRGEIFIVMADFDAAESALQTALALEQQIERPRLAWDIHQAMAWLYRQTGRQAAAEQHEAAVRQIVAELAANIPQEKWRGGLPV